MDFGLVFEKNQMGKLPKSNKAGTKYYMRDFYLNFYFQVLETRRSQIEQNTKKNLFSYLISSKSGYYIPEFSGLAFELLVESVVDRRANISMDELIFSKLRLQSSNYRWGHFSDHSTTQADLVVESPEDRESRVLEARWIGTKATLKQGYS